MNISPFPRQRRHTYYFLQSIRGFAPVFLDTDVDMTAVRRLQYTAEARYSTAAVVILVAAKVLSRHPEANAAIRPGLRPQILTHEHVDVKVALDKTLDGRRVVLSVVIREADLADLDQVQDVLTRYRTGDSDRMAEFTPVRRLQSLPMALGSAAFRRVLRGAEGRRRALGTLAVSSLGHRPVNGFHSVGGTTITLGLGQVVDRAVVREGAVTVAPVLRLNLAFDHRVVDGAEAADLLADLKQALEEADSGELLPVRPAKAEVTP